MDGVDATLVKIGPSGIRFRHHVHLPYPSSLLNTLRCLSLPGDSEIDVMGIADVEVAKVLAQAIHQLLRASGYHHNQITAIGCHGQTIRHRPRATNPIQESSGFTLQIGDPNTLAVATGIPVIADFRRKDMALGGQGAPLAPGFHLAAMHDHRIDQVVLNLGGIANITYLPAEANANQNSVIGFDTGPANTLLDTWFQQHHSGSFDTDGTWASGGQVCTHLLQQLLSDPYFALPFPKSTGKEYFSLAWLSEVLKRFPNLSARDVQTTLVELSVQSITTQIHQLSSVDKVYVCGGGVFNVFLMQRLTQSLNTMSVESSLSMGIDPMHIESMAFAWLAYRRWHRLSGNLPSVTGAIASAVLGSIYLPD